MSHTITPEMLATLSPHLEALREIGDLILTQNNRCTDQPLFIVQQLHRISGIDTNYTDNICWFSHYDYYTVTDGEEFDRLEQGHKDGKPEPDGWTRSGYHDEWVFVTACFTEQGCKDYLAANGHNLKSPRIYADGSYRNSEFRAVRSALTALAIATKEQAK